MEKIKTAKQILKELGVTEKQQNDLSCNVLLALANIKEDSQWTDAENSWIRIHDIISYLSENYNINYAENSRETIRKQVLHHFNNAAFIENNNKSTNSPNYKYRLTHEFLELIRTYSTKSWDLTKKNFLENHKTLVEKYTTKRELTKIPVVINNENLTFSKGEHNQLQKLIIEEFGPRFAPGAECLYVGDTIKKDLVKENKKLEELGLSITTNDKMPDVILYLEDKRWLYFIEAVTSVGPMDYKRIEEIKELTKNVEVGIIYVTAFLDFKTYKKFSEKLAWDTEVWIANSPEHMIHLNGDRFLGPRK
jgi:putative type II site-specific deoxyribonuclease